jgi:Ni,Fe-hydrogenase III component G
MSDRGLASGDEVVTRITSALGDRIIDLQQPSEKRLYLEVGPNVIPDTAQLLFNHLEARFQTASAVDAPRQIEILYHWALDSIGLVVTVRTRIDRDQPEIASITPICPAAHWIEREMWELMGISFRDHPDLRHLLLEDDWPDGKYPLRRDYRRE